MISRAEMLYKELEGTQQQKKRSLEYKKKRCLPQTTSASWRSCEGARLRKKSYQQRRLDDWEHLTKLTAIWWGYCLHRIKRYRRVSLQPERQGLEQWWAPKANIDYDVAVSVQRGIDERKSRWGDVCWKFKSPTYVDDAHCTGKKNVLYLKRCDIPAIVEESLSVTCHSEEQAWSKVSRGVERVRC